MTHKKTLSITLIIPVYNEENNLPRCLSAIAAQTVMPDEVIVVDNNSTDRSVEIAKKYPFVRIVHEKKQGMIPARDRGFLEASADILGRIDADMMLHRDWVKVAKRDFENPAVAAITGYAKLMNTSVGNPIPTSFWAHMYFWVAEANFGVPILWGANMAIRRDDWLIIKDQTCKDGLLVHEDQDISLLLASHGLRAYRDAQLKADSNIGLYNWPKYKEYFIRSVRTKHYHQKMGSYTPDNLVRLSMSGRMWRMLLGGGPAMLATSVSLVTYSPHYVKQHTKTSSRSRG